MTRLRDLVRSRVTDREDFEQALGTLVLASYRNGVNVEGGSEVRARADLPDFEVQIVELRKPNE